MGNAWHSLFASGGTKADWESLWKILSSYEYWGQSEPIHNLFVMSSSPQMALFWLLCWYIGLFISAFAYRYLVYLVLRGSGVIGYGPELRRAERYCMRAGAIVGFLSGFLVFHNFLISFVIGVLFFVCTAGIGAEASSSNREAIESERKRSYI